MPTPFWQPPPPRPDLRPEEVHVWRVSLAPEAGEVDRLRGALSPDEVERAARFRYDRHRRRYTVARGRLREILSRYTDVSPEDLAFRYGDHGKPELTDSASGPSFNVSHSGDHALVAIARDRRLGVDLEVVRPLPDADAIAERFFSASEVAAYRAVPEAARPAAFFACWTRKEAFVKAVGDGLTYGLSTFDASVTPEADTPLLRVRGADARAVGWDAADVPLDSALAAAVAADRPGWRLVGWHDSTLAGALRAVPSLPPR